MDCLPRVWEGWSGLWAGVLSVYRCNPQPRIEIAACGFKIRAPSTIFIILFFFIIKKTFQNSSRAINRHPVGHKRPAGRYLSMTALDHSKQTPRNPIPLRAPRATAIRRRTELLAVILYIQILYSIVLYIELRESQTVTFTLSSMLQFTPD